MAGQANTRLRQIDFLRGVAVILVLFRHHYLVEPLYRAGWIGVDLFFVLSGFLVSGLLFKAYQENGEVHGIHFLIRRGFKIYPLFYLALIITVILRFSLSEKISWYDFLSEFFFVQNYLGMLWNHTWSLAIEEHFYFGLTALVILAIRRNWLEDVKKVIWFCTIVLTMCLLIRLVNSLLWDFSYRRHLFHTHVRIDSLLFGVLLSYLYYFKKDAFQNFFEKRRRTMYLAGLVFISPAFVLELSNPLITSFGLTLLYLGFGFILSNFIVDQKINGKLDRVLNKNLVDLIAKIGLHSYAVYLFHMFVKNYFLRMVHYFGFEWGERVDFVIYFVVSIVVGIVISKSIEIPFLKIRDNYFPRKTGGMNIQKQSLSS